MTTISAAVYLNHGRDSFGGFTASHAHLSKAAQFELTLPEPSPAGRRLADVALEVIFSELNIDAPEHDWALRYRLAGHRSFSVGDVAVIGESAYACDSVGWTHLSTDALAAAITS